MASLTIKGLTKKYDNGCLAVKDFDLDIKDGEFVVLVGASGCGKSTFLRMVAGLEEITEGKLFIGDRDVTNTAPSDRDIAMVFQNYALYPQMTVYQNLAFALNMRKARVRTPQGKVVRKHLHPDNIHSKVMEAAEMLGLVNQLNKRPRQLSGGQQQRVAVGRAMVRQPKVFLFDEPLSNLDAKLRSEMRYEIKLLHQQLKATMIYVTHDQIEALTLADRIVVMNHGYILQVGTPIELYRNPVNTFVASFIGLPPMNLIEVSVSEEGTVLTEGLEYQLSSEEAEILKNYKGKSVVMGIRPEHIFNQGNTKLKVFVSENLGQFTLVHGHIGNIKVVCKFDGWREYSHGEIIEVGISRGNVHFFDKDTGFVITEDDFVPQNFTESSGSCKVEEVRS